MRTYTAPLFITPEKFNELLKAWKTLYGETTIQIKGTFDITTEWIDVTFEDWVEVEEVVPHHRYLMFKVTIRGETKVVYPCETGKEYFRFTEKRTPSATFGYPSKEPCAVCGEHKNNQSEPRFGYTVCEDHQNVPPTEIRKR